MKHKTWDMIESKLFGAKIFKFMIGTFAWLVFIMLVLGMVKLIFNFLFPVPVEPTDMSALLNTYLGLPLIFWIFVGCGICFGLTVHGFKLIYVTEETNTKADGKSN